MAAEDQLPETLKPFFHRATEAQVLFLFKNLKPFYRLIKSFESLCFSLVLGFDLIQSDEMNKQILNLNSHV